MADVEAVTVGEASYHLAENTDSFVFREAAVRYYMIEQLSALYVLEDKISESMLLVLIVAGEMETYSSPLFSQTSYRLIIFGCSINFIITTSLSIPNGITRLPSCAAETMVSMTARLVLRRSSADFLLTILMAAS